MAFRWHADNGPKLNGCFFDFSVDPYQFFLRNPIFFLFFRGGGSGPPAPPPPSDEGHAFYVCNHLDGEEIADHFTVIVFLVKCNC